jgi:hypothetical protein
MFTVQWQAPLMSQALDGLVGADLVAEMVTLALVRGHGLAELIVESFGFEVALFLGHPFVQPEMRADDELGHASFLVLLSAPAG